MTTPATSVADDSRAVAGAASTVASDGDDDDIVIKYSYTVRAEETGEEINVTVRQNTKTVKFRNSVAKALHMPEGAEVVVVHANSGAQMSCDADTTIASQSRYLPGGSVLICKRL